MKALEAPDFEAFLEDNHISLIRVNLDASKTPLTMPNHKEIKSSSLLFYLKTGWNNQRRVYANVR